MEGSVERRKQRSAYCYATSWEHPAVVRCYGPHCVQSEERK
jgi:hypothetical protein